MQGGVAPTEGGAQPFGVNTRLNAAVDSLLRINREKGQNKQSPCQGDARPETARNKASFWVSAHFSTRFFLMQCEPLRSSDYFRYSFHNGSLLVFVVFQPKLYKVSLFFSIPVPGRFRLSQGVLGKAL
jgi:hypothetical protein